MTLGPRPGPFRTKLVPMDPNNRPTRDKIVNEFYFDDMPFVSVYEQNNKDFLVETGTAKETERLFSAEGKKILDELKLTPIVPPKIRAQRTVILKKVNEIISTYEEEEIKNEILQSRNQSEWMKIEKVTKFGTKSTLIKIEFSDVSMADRALRDGVVMFHLLHPSVYCEREFFHEILTCMRCYEVESHRSGHCPKGRDYKICSECSQEGHRFDKCPNKQQKKCLLCQQDGHNAISFKCPRRRAIVKQEYEKFKNPIKISYSQATNPNKTPTTTTQTPIGPQLTREDYGQMFMCMTNAHMHNLVNPGTYNKTLNEALLRNHLPSVQLEDNPPSAAILTSLGIPIRPAAGMQHPATD